MKEAEKAKPARIQRSRQHKQVSPNGLPIVYVGRPTIWGNKYKVGKTIKECDTLDGTINPNCKEVVHFLCDCIPGISLRQPYTKNKMQRMGWTDDTIITAEIGVELYASDLENHLVYDDIEGNGSLNAKLEKLIGKNLSCWCKIGERCHADYLIEMLND